MLARWGQVATAGKERSAKSGGETVRVALLTTFAASRKEPLAEMLQRVYQAFSGAGLGEPAVRFNFGDMVLPGSVSSVDRVLKRHPELARFVTTAVLVPLVPGARRITNDSL